MPGSHPAPRLRLASPAVAVLLVTVLVPAAPSAQTVQDLNVPDKAVYSTAIAGGTIYVGGIFQRIGPATGSAVPLDAASGTPLALPRVAGTVKAIVTDGSGGWYIGGSFTHVGGQPRANIAHIEADHTVSAWNPGASLAVQALAVGSGVVYAGGNFNSIGGQPRAKIAALDATTGLATGWNPNPDPTS